MKNWRTDAILRAEDISTFLSVMFQRLQTKNAKSLGYLYHTCKLQIDLREDFVYSGKIISTRFLHDDDVEINTNEINFDLRDYQREAVQAIVDYDFEESNFGTLTMPCGTGKTLVYAKYLQQTRPEVVIILAPLIALVQQNAKRLEPFLSGYTFIHVHSGEDGDTNVDEVVSQIEDHGHICICSTFDSFLNILGQLEFDFDEDNIVVIVDEAHNIISENLDIQKSLKEFPKVILVTATPPSAFDDFSNEIYCYKLGDAITNKHVCDYKIWVPSILYATPIFENISFEENSLAAKALFLINNMLQKGSRRCIVYLSSTEEVEEFTQLIERIARDYHGVPIWTGSVISTTRYRERARVFKEFEEQDHTLLDKLYVLCSIRILDEGIDLVTCDSVFISSVSEHSSTIRLVQSMCRANRIDCQNSTKISNVFIWNHDDFSKIIHVLEKLREVDPEYKKKSAYRQQI